MEDQKLAVLRQIIEQGFGNADLYVIDQLVADDYMEHQFNMKGGKEGLKKAILSLSNAFSNHEYELISSSVQGDMVWAHYRSEGEHTGPFMGREPTGKKFSIDVIDIARIGNGKLVEHWGVPDRFALLLQLGFFPSSNTKP